MGIEAIVCKLLSFTRTTRNGGNVSDVKVDPGGTANITGEHFADAGDDSHPLPTDYPILVPLEREGVFSSIGYTDPLNTPKALPGEKRIYGRSEDGTPVNEVWLKNDGTIFINNDVGSTEIKPDGKITTTNGKGTNTIEPEGEIKSNNANGSITIKETGDIESVNAGGSIKLTPAGILTAEALVSMALTAPLIQLIGAVQILGGLVISGAIGLLGGGGPVQMTGGVNNTGGDIVSDGKSLEVHTHPYTWTDPAGSDNTGAPN